jgi:2-polyprenyl-3-methyl-5-hydroxy-6-metoxy-1,4-benzoquinol methylase
VGEDLPHCRYDSAEPSCANLYLWPMLDRKVQALRLTPGTKIFDLGCGNGTIAGLLHARGFDVTGVDPSPSGIEFARSRQPQVRLEGGSAYDDLAARYGCFPLVVSLEVVEPYSIHGTMNAP